MQEDVKSRSPENLQEVSRAHSLYGGERGILESVFKKFCEERREVIMNPLPLNAPLPYATKFIWRVSLMKVVRGLCSRGDAYHCSDGLSRNCRFDSEQQAMG